MDNQAVIQRIKFLISELRLRQNSFANRIGTDVSNLSKHLNGRLPISDSLVNKIVVNLGISKDWLVNGTVFQGNGAFHCGSRWYDGI